VCPCVIYVSRRLCVSCRCFIVIILSIGGKNTYVQKKLVHVKVRVNFLYDLSKMRQMRVKHTQTTATNSDGSDIRFPFEIINALKWTVIEYDSLVISVHDHDDAYPKMMHVCTEHSSMNDKHTAAPTGTANVDYNNNTQTVTSSSFTNTNTNNNNSETELKTERDESQTGSEWKGDGTTEWKLEQFLIVATLRIQNPRSQYPV